MKKKETSKTAEMEVGSTKEQVGKGTQAKENTPQEDEVMANEFEEVVNIMGDNKKKKFMEMEDDIKREYLEYFEQQGKQEEAGMESEPEEEQNLEGANMTSANQVPLPESEDEGEGGGRTKTQGPSEENSEMGDHRVDKEAICES